MVRHLFITGEHQSLPFASNAEPFALYGKGSTTLLLHACHFLQHRKLVFPCGSTQSIKFGCWVAQQRRWTVQNVSLSTQRPQVGLPIELNDPSLLKEHHLEDESKYPWRLKVFCRYLPYHSQLPCVSDALSWGWYFLRIRWRDHKSQRGDLGPRIDRQLTVESFFQSIRPSHNPRYASLMKVVSWVKQLLTHLAVA